MMSETTPPTLGYQSKASVSPPRPICAKCGLLMVQGLTCNDAGGGSRVEGVAVWLEGEVKRRWLGLLRFPKGRRYEVVTFRCRGCGLLESYTPRG